MGLDREERRDEVHRHHQQAPRWPSASGTRRSAPTRSCRRPSRRDILRELSDACKEEGITLCFYHSIMDWHHPDAQSIGFPNYNGAPSNPNFPRYVENYLKPQCKELLSYGPIGVMWFDGEWIKDWTEPMARDMVKYLRGLRPELIINNRVGKGRQGMQGMSKDPTITPAISARRSRRSRRLASPAVDWESCMTMNDTWGVQEGRQSLEARAAGRAHADRLLEQGREFPAECRPDGRGPDPRPERRAAGRSRQVDEGQQRSHLRHERQPVQEAGIWQMHPPAGQAVPARVRLAQGRHASAFPWPASRRMPTCWPRPISG